MQTTKLKRFATRLLATTCLTAATSVAAFGTTIALTEGAQKTFAGRYMASAGTTEVDGTVTTSSGGGGADWFELTGLGSGTSFSTLDLTVTDISGNGFSATFFTDTDVLITGPQSVGTSTPFSPTGSVPADGNLVVEIVPGSEAASNYKVTLTTGTPEPGTLGTLGLALAGLAGVGLRRRAKQS